jgi:hypothetical protein
MTNPTPKAIAAEIAARRKKAADLRRQADLLDAEARGMEIVNNMATMQAAGSAPESVALVAAPLTSAPPLIGSPAITVHKGRQKGAISHTWREILGELYAQFPDGFSENEVCAAAARHNLNIRPKDARDRMTSYIDSNYTAMIGDKFRVTHHALEKFRLPNG